MATQCPFRVSRLQNQRLLSVYVFTGARSLDVGFSQYIRLEAIETEGRIITRDLQRTPVQRS
jgi:hypothetical protein